MYPNEIKWIALLFYVITNIKWKVKEENKRGQINVRKRGLGLYQKTQTKETLRNYQKVIKSSLRDATYYFGFIGNDPAGSLQFQEFYHLSQKNNAKHVYTIDKIEKILSRFKENKGFICTFLTACYTGMRTGEVFALTWNDIDLESRIIKVNKTV